MKKLYLMFVLANFVMLTYAQKRPTPVPDNSGPAVRRLLYPKNGTNADCDKLNFPVPETWGTPTIYTYDSKSPLDSGFITGMNFYDDVEKAQFFDASSTSDVYITEAYIGFGRAYSADSSLTVAINVYDASGTGGSPKKLLSTTNVIMSTIMADVRNHNYTDVVFNPAIKLPASKQFFVSVDMSNLEWYKDVADTLAVYSSKINAATGAWERFYTSQSATAWANFPTNYGGRDLALYIHPFLSINQTCGTLPVHLLSFNAQLKGKDAQLGWKVTQELNMKSYIVEKALGTNTNFTAIGTTPATNATADHAYTFIDANALAANTTAYYRLKQVNSDGRADYSNIIKLQPADGAVGIKVVNPFRGAVQLQVNVPYGQKLQGGIYDMAGRRVATAAQVLSAGQNTVTIPALSLPKGVYMLKIAIGKDTYTYKIIN